MEIDLLDGYKMVIKREVDFNKIKISLSKCFLKLSELPEENIMVKTR